MKNKPFLSSAVLSAVLLVSGLKGKVKNMMRFGQTATILLSISVKFNCLSLARVKSFCWVAMAMGLSPMDRFPTH